MEGFQALSWCLGDIGRCSHGLTRRNGGDCDSDALIGNAERRAGYGEVGTEGLEVAIGQ